MNRTQKRSKVRRALRVEALETRKLMAADAGLFESNLEKIQEDGKDNDKAMVSESKVPARKSDSWYGNLSLAVQASIESAIDLKRFEPEELKQATSWAIVGKDANLLDKLLGDLPTKSIKDRTSLFRGQISKPVVEVQLKASVGYEKLLERVQPGREGVLAVLPQFTYRAEATGTLDPATVTDPNFAAQWFLDPSANSTQYGIDAEGAWAHATGEDVRVAIVDSRQDLLHPDLAPNLDITISYDDADFDWNGDGVGDNIPNVTLQPGSPSWPRIPDTDTDGDGILEDVIQQQAHGTAVAGLAVGDDDGTGTVGVAPDATYAAFNYLDGDQSMPDTFALQNIRNIDVFNNSWGVGNTRNLIGRSFLELQAIENAAVEAIFVKSAGNNRDAADGFAGWDRANYDSIQMRQSVIVGATQQDGRAEWYSTPGSNVLVTAPVNRSGSLVNTITSDVTDPVGSNADNRGYVDGNTINSFNGTSAAAPLVSGTIALMLEANPDLTWRDVQHILIDTAQKNGLIDSDGDGAMDGADADADGLIDDISLRSTFLASVDTNADGVIDGILDTDLDGVADPYHTGWFQNAAGNWVSDSYGFGIVDAAAAAQLAGNWRGVSEELKVASVKQVPGFAQVPEGSLGGLNSLADIDTFDAESHMHVEWVEITVNAEAPSQDDLMLVLKSPSGTQSILMAPGGQSSNADIQNFTFTTNQFWDETADGKWTLQALDVGTNDGQAIKILDWQIAIYGSCDEVSPLNVKPMAESDLSLEGLAELVLAAGGIGSEGYQLNRVFPVGNGLAMGTFEQGHDSDLPIDSGLLFTTGKAVDAIGPNNSEHTTTAWENVGGHHLLDGLTGTRSEDASGVEVYFTATSGGWLSFEAIFGSEEFDEWVGSKYNDGAGIFVTELKSNDVDYKAGHTTNILRTPSGNELTVNKLAGRHPDNSVSGKHYDPNPACGDMNWEYDGSSVLVETPQYWLTAGNHYYVSVLIGDAADEGYDSGLALSLDRAATVSEKSLSIPVDGLSKLSTSKSIAARSDEQHSVLTEDSVLQTTEASTTLSSAGTTEVSSASVESYSARLTDSVFADIEASKEKAEDALIVNLLESTTLQRR